MKRISLSLIVFILTASAAFFFAVPKQVYAVDPYYNESFRTWKDAMKKADGPQPELFRESADQTSLNNNMNGLVAVSIGTTDKDSVFYYKKSTLAQIGNAMAFMYQAPPANTYAFVQDMGQSLGFIPKKAYAADGQGSGYKGLLPILPIWKAFRNIAYGLLAVSMIVVGFMIMFRRKIDPKTVMTVQNALPRIVVALLLITFSYAIAGFLIDLMYVFMYMSIEILDKSGMQGMDAKYLQDQYSNGGFLALFSGVMRPMWTFVNKPLTQIIPNLLQGKFLESFLSALETLAFNASALGSFFILILSLGYLFVFIRLLIKLFSCYIQILLAVIIAPLQLLLDVFPGSTQTANWFKGIIANLAAFPITIFMLILGDAISKNFGAGTLWEPPLITHTAINAGPIQLEGASAELGLVIIWLGIVSAIPTVIDKVKEALKAKPLMQGGGLMPAGTGSTVMGATNFFFQANQLTGGKLAEILKLTPKRER